MRKKVAGKREKVERRKGLSVALSIEERAVLEELGEKKYHGLAGVSTVLRKEGIESARREIERLTKESAHQISEK